MNRLWIAKSTCAILVTIVFGLMIRTVGHFSETRGVFDDLCYLRQAHLFQRFGLDGLNTDITRETDGYLAGRLRAIGYSRPDDPDAPCHNRIAATGRIVSQYPPGTGFLLAAFSEGRQVGPFYAMVTTMLFGVALATIAVAATPVSLAAAAALGGLSLYLMNNPMKSSYSLPPTMILCALAGALTAWLVATSNPRRILLVALLGFVFGLGVNFRIANILLPLGAGLYLAIRFVRQPRPGLSAEGLAFGAAALIAMTPTLLANAINAGSPFATTYSGQDAAAPDFALPSLAAQIMRYLTGTQGVLIALAVGLTTAACWRGGLLRRAGLITASMLAANLVYFLSHPVYTPYYLVPATMLALWTILFAFLYETSADRPASLQMLSGTSI